MVRAGSDKILSNCQVGEIENMLVYAGTLILFSLVYNLSAGTNAVKVA